MVADLVAETEVEEDEEYVKSEIEELEHSQPEPGTRGEELGPGTLELLGGVEMDRRLVAVPLTVVPR